MCAGRTSEGLGCVTWWGFSPARDLLNAAEPVRWEGEVNVLLIGSSDPRHILKTIADLKSKNTLHVWVIENSMEVIARQLLLLFLSLTPPGTMGLHEKVEVFLEVFGNSEIRCQTEECIKLAASHLTLSVTDSLDTHIHPCLDTSLLKFKERDQLVWIFQQWLHPPSNSPSMNKAWDSRVRQYLGTRYDSRHGCYNWDLAMKLHQKGCGVINKHQYDKWRDGGVAFEMREGLYQKANPSLLSSRAIFHRGDRMALKGYWGDIVTGPYICFGIETDDKELRKKQNGIHVKTAQDISFANIQGLFQSLTCRWSSRPGSPQESDESASSKQSNQTSGCLSLLDSSANSETQETDSHEDIRTANESPESQSKSEKLLHQELMNVSGVQVSFLPMDSLSKLSEKEKYSGFFHIIYCSASMVAHLQPTLKQIAAPEAVLVVELAKYLLDLSKEQEAGFAERVTEIAKEAGFILAQEDQNNVHAIFNLQKQ
ncbi:dynein assembly factor 3, axonemal isoform X2 [Denticeps clupeoides]|nr:dynein assembly factor 3, axonemal isoform X2 [Denticeps clupeoides]